MKTMSKELKALERIETFLKENCKHYKQDVDYIREALQRLEVMNQIFEGIKKYPKIINESVRFDSSYGVQMMLVVSAEAAKEIKDTWYKISKIIEKDKSE